MAEHGPNTSVFSTTVCRCYWCWTTSYVLVETVALMDRRLGFASVLDFEGWRSEAHIEVLWIDASSHEQETWRQYATCIKGEA